MPVKPPEGDPPQDLDDLSDEVDVRAYEEDPDPNEEEGEEDEIQELLNEYKRLKKKHENNQNLFLEPPGFLLRCKVRELRP
jgi:hypothetical protein